MENNNVQAQKFQIISHCKIINPKTNISEQCGACLKNSDFNKEIIGQEPVQQLEDMGPRELAIEAQGSRQEYVSITGTDDIFNANEKTGKDQKCSKQKSTGTKQRKYARCSKIKNFENYEKLFIRLVKLDAGKLNNTGHSSNLTVTTNEKIETQQLSSVKADFKPIVNKCALKVPRGDLERNNLLVNKTESIRMEELLLKQFKKAKEKGDSKEDSKEPPNSAFEVEPYEYQKTQKSVYETHVETVTANGETNHCCLLCPFVGQSFHQISLHHKFKHKETPIEEMYFCNLRDCQFKTVHKGMLKWHMRRHMLVGNKLISDVFSCKQCDKVFEHRKGFLIHLKHMHKEPLAQKLDFPCSTCKFRATTKGKLESHIYKCHIPDNAKPKFTCNICGFETLYKDSFKKHLTNVHLKNH